MRVFLLVFLALFAGTNGYCLEKINLDKTKGFEGFFNFYYSDLEGKVYLEVKNTGSQFLYVNSLSQGVGNNDLLLDGGQLGNTRIVYFKKAGNKLLLIQPNLKFRAITNNELERKSVENAFAKSVIFGFPIKSKTEHGYLIDLTPFLLEDAHNVGKVLREMNQGTYSVDKSRSVVASNKLKAFPKNVELEALITFKGTPKGEQIKEVTPNPKFLTVFQHHSFIELPDSGFIPRKYDPRCGSNLFSFYDYASPIDEPLLKKYISRHRLEKVNPNAKLSPAKEPIIYYLDNGTPEPIRTALVEGGKWWNEAFEAIGFKDAFQVKILPKDIDPMDVRYNVIQWVHRSTRGWSYGMSISDPRTGEIIKGHVCLGSLRIRQDFLIAQALSKAPFKVSDKNNKLMFDLALSRIKQLSAHEIGHTLGFRHNFASSVNNRASVMDYPHPKITLVDGEISFDNAYDEGIGKWDKVAVSYAYGIYPQNEELELNKILTKAFEQGLRYVSDEDSRSLGGSHGFSHLWDNGADPSEELLRVISIRKKAIEQFSINNIRKGEPFSNLENLFVPLYFFHRYQTEAVVKLIGGMDYQYAVRDGKNKPPVSIETGLQKKAFSSILRTLDAKFLAIPKDKLPLFQPRGFSEKSRESFDGKLGGVFDPLGAASTSAKNVLDILFHPERASRLVFQKVLDKNTLGFSDMLEGLIQNSWKKEYNDPYLNEIQNGTKFLIINGLINLAQNDMAYFKVRFIIDEKLLILKSELLKKKNKSSFDLGVLRVITNYFENPKEFTFKNEVPRIPDGSPIGSTKNDCSH